MTLSQAVPHPFGITVLGSAMIRVSPDLVSIVLGVSATAPHPRDAFTEARSLAQAVRVALSQVGAGETGTSRIGLESVTRYMDGQQRFIGYRAHTRFHILTTELDRLEAILAAAVDGEPTRSHR